jgi:hypothetical protein
MTDVESHYETDRLAQLLRTRYECLLELRDLGRRQMELIERGELAALLDLLTTRQRSIDRLQRIERALDPFRDQSPQQRRWRSAEHRQQCAALIEQCQSLLAEIIAREKQCETALLHQREQTLALLQRMQMASNVQGMYTADMDIAGSQINMLSEG